MRKTVLASLVLATALSACSGARESRLNPFNWFGRSTSVVVAEPAESEVNALIPKRRSIFARSPEPPFVALGGHDVRLVEQEDGDPATLSFEFLALQPPGGTGVGSAHTRSVTAARILTEQELFGVHTIRVISKSNVRTVRR